MGTDIHGVFQAQRDGQWIDVPSEWDGDRNYQLFAVLAGVRNGYGFAGIKTGEAVKPISAPRGFPDDFPIDSWLGDHTYSWLSSGEMLAWAEAADKPILRTGVITKAQYEAWDGNSRPLVYCGECMGPGIIVITDNEVAKRDNPGWTDIQIEWQESLMDRIGEFFAEVRRLHDLHGGVRLVFGFDS